MTKTVHGEITVSNSPNEVFRALADSGQLTSWFAEHALVDLPERWEVWGRYTPGALQQGSARPRLTSASPGEHLAFDWQLYNRETAVQIDLNPSGVGTAASVSHSGLDDPASWLLDAYWSMSLENLRSWVQFGREGLLIDFTAIGPGDVEISANIDAPPEAVFGALTDPRQLERYMAREANVDLRIGGDYDIGWEGEGPVKVVNLTPNELIAYSWKVADQEELTVVTWSLEGSSSRTRLTLVHTGFVPDRAAIDYNAGWLDYINRIKAMSETGDSWTRPQISVQVEAPVSTQPHVIP